MSEYSEYETEVVPALDLASVIASVGRPVFRDRRAVWKGVMGRAIVGAPGLPLSVQDRDLDGFVWNPSLPRGSRWNRPAIRVRRSLVQALPDRPHPAASLADALEQAAKLPDETGPLGRDAAVLVVSGVTLGLADAIAHGPRHERERLAGLLLRASRQSRRREVAELTDFAGKWVRQAGPPSVVPADLPRLLRTEEPTAGPMEARIRDRVAGLVSAGAAESTIPGLGLRVVHPLLTQASTTHRDVLGLNLDAIGWGISGALTGDVAEEPAAHLVRPEPSQSADRVNVGVVGADRPDHPVTGGAMVTGTDYLLWVSLGPRDDQAVPDDDEPLDLSGVPDDDVLDVAVFPDSALAVPDAIYTGSFVMGQERPLRVRRAAERLSAGGPALTSRLYFALRTPPDPGTWDVRVLVYHRNALLQVRLLTLPVGRPRARLTVRTPYTVVRSLTASSLGELSKRRLSVYVNETSDGGHRMCFRGHDGREPWEGSAPLNDQAAGGLINQIRRGLRKVSWATEAQWNPKSRSNRYRYPAVAGNDRFAPNFTQLQEDLFLLADRGFATWEYMTSLMGDPGEQEQLCDRMRVPGIVEMAPAHGSRLIPPLAGLYDIRLDARRELSLCPDVKEVLQDGGDLAALHCFQAGCPHAGLTTVCPSGFWGLRHQVTVPTSLGKAAEEELRISAGKADLSASLIGTMPEIVLGGVTAHASDVAGRFGQSQHVTSRDEWLQEAPGDRYDVLYFLCHGGQDRQTGDSVIILDKPGSPGIHRSDLNAYGVRFAQHRPLVVLNACETAALVPDKVITLVEGFTYYGASAVIGTEITVFNSLAYEFGTSLLDSFVGRRCHLGEAVRRARLNLLSKWNPLGLVYVAYGLADLQLARDAEERPAA